MTTKRFCEIYDKNKLTEEDRRLVFNYVTDSALFNTTGKMQNAVIVLSITAILVSTFSIVLFFAGLSIASAITGLINLCVFVYLLSLYIESNKKLNNIIKGNIQDHLEIQAKHFEYAKNKTTEKKFLDEHKDNIK